MSTCRRHNKVVRMDMLPKGLVNQLEAEVVSIAEEVHDMINTYSACERTANEAVLALVSEDDYFTKAQAIHTKAINSSIRRRYLPPTLALLRLVGYIRCAPQTGLLRFADSKRQFYEMLNVSTIVEDLYKLAKGTSGKDPISVYVHAITTYPEHGTEVVTDAVDDVLQLKQTITQSKENLASIKRFIKRYNEAVVDGSSVIVYGCCSPIAATLANLRLEQ